MKDLTQEMLDAQQRAQSFNEQERIRLAEAGWHAQRNERFALKVRIRELEAWKRRAVESMNAACAAAGVECCDELPREFGRLKARAEAAEAKAEQQGRYACELIDEAKRAQIAEQAALTERDRLLAVAEWMSVQYRVLVSDLDQWASYADPHFREKHDYAAVLAGHQTHLKRFAAALSEGEKK